MSRTILRILDTLAILATQILDIRHTPDTLRILRILRIPPTLDPLLYTRGTRMAIAARAHMATVIVTAFPTVTTATATAMAFPIARTGLRTILAGSK